jgi:predicted DNA-binding transcriptional regulator
MALLEAAIHDSQRAFSVRTHQRAHRISHETSRQDLLGLQRAGLLAVRRVGRGFVWTPVADLSNKLSQPQ